MANHADDGPGPAGGGHRRAVSDDTGQGGGALREASGTTRLEEPGDAEVVRPRSVWMDLVGTDGEDGREPAPPRPLDGAAPGQWDDPGETPWPAAGLPPDFGQARAAAPAPGQPGRWQEEPAAAPAPPWPRAGEAGPAASGAGYAGAATADTSQPHAAALPFPGGDLQWEPLTPPWEKGADTPDPVPPAATQQPRAAGPVPVAEPTRPQEPAPQQALHQQAAPPQVVPPSRVAETSDSLTSEVLLPGRHAQPRSGWQKMVFHATGGLVRAPQSAAQQRRRSLIARARTPVAGGHHRVAVLSLKGGVGKTTTAVGLGATLASLRGDRVIAVDANPDRGTLCDKLRLETAATVRDLLSEREHIHRYADVRAFTTQAPSRLEVLASDRDPTVSVAFSAADYHDVANVLEHYYSICITDCGTGLLHSAMAGVLDLADQIVLISSPSVDGARSASATLDWLAAHSHGDLVREAVVVLCAVLPRRRSTVDLDRLEKHFATRCRSVVWIPYDAHLAEGSEVDPARMGRATADAYLALAAEVGDGFAWPRRRYQDTD